MAFLPIEQSSNDGLPQECFKFEYTTESWNLTSSKQDVDLGGDTYEATFIKRGTLRNENDMFSTALTVTVAQDNPVALKFRTWIEDAILLTVYRQHYGDNDPVVLWSGKVSSCKFKDGQAELACTPLYTTLKRLGLLRVYQRSCPHVQYGTACTLDSAVWESEVVATSVLDKIISFSGSFPINYFAGGSAVFGDEKRWIVSSTVSSITVLAPFINLVDESTIKIIPGCQHDKTKCKDTFNNLDNNGGFFFIPSKNPFQVSLLG